MTAEREFLQRVARACESAAGGNLEARVGATPDDPDLRRIGAALDRLLDVVDAYVRESTASMDHCSRGLFHRPVLERGLPGAYGDAALTLNRAARKMRDDSGDLRRYEAELEAVNRGLEATVAERTGHLEERRQAIERILDQVSEGLVALDRSGVMDVEQSRALTGWFGTAPPGTRFWDYLRSVDPRVGADFEAGWAQLVEDVLPMDLCLDQLPRRLALGSRIFELAYRPSLEGGALRRVLVVVSDITSQLGRLRAEAAREELVRMFEAIRKDRVGFLEFFAEARDLVTLLGQDGSLGDVELARLIHTLKGNCAIYGISSFAGACHELEAAMQDSGARPSAADAARLASRWAELSDTIDRLVGDSGSRRIEIDDAEYSGILSAVRRGAPRAELVRMIAEWKLEPAERRLERVGEQARSLAAQLGKGEIVVRVEGGGLRLSPRHWADFWRAFAHVVRNAVDHGLEVPGERTAAGKSGAGTIELRAAKQGAELVIEIADDGRGIDWDRLADKARLASLPCATAGDLEAALFADGVSTRDFLTETSGRGIGMAAVRSACERLGGRVGVTSARGRGTTVRFAFPAATMSGREIDGLAGVPVHATLPPGVRAATLPGDA